MDAAEIDTPDDIRSPRALSPEEVTAEFRADVEALEESAVELADRMHKLGDPRPYSTILRGIQRMMSGETRVSGEMRVLVTMMLRQQRRLQQLYADVTWKRLANGAWSAKAGEFYVTLSPQTRGRWLVNVAHKGGYSHPWPRWQDSLETAKRKAFVTIEDATDFLLVPPSVP